MWYVFSCNSVEHQTLFQSGWFIEGLLSQTLIVHMIRTQKYHYTKLCFVAGYRTDCADNGYWNYHSFLSFWNFNRT